MNRSRSAFELFGLLALAAGTAAAQPYRSPLDCDGCIEQVHYVDHGGVLDWSCGGATYFGHLGSDYALRGGNAAIDRGHAVVAIAAGTVVSSQDGFFDRCTQCGGAGCGRDFGAGFGNHVVVDHGAYSVTYAHLRMGSVRVAPGAQVACGQRLGDIGSSGCSTAAHLHVELRAPGAADTTDPYAGACSPTPASLWADQGGYLALPSATCAGAAPDCAEAASEHWTCDDANTERRRCQAGVAMREPCPYGCEPMPAGADALCALPPDADADASRADVDCDDGNAAIHPGALEVCGDGIDQDCSGRDRSCRSPRAGGEAPAPPDASAGASAPPRDAGRADGGARDAGRAGRDAAPEGAAGHSPVDADAGNAGRGGDAAAPVPDDAGSTRPPRSPPRPDRPAASGCSTSPGAPRTPGVALQALAAALLYARGRRRKPIEQTSKRSRFG